MACTNCRALKLKVSKPIFSMDLICSCSHYPQCRPSKSGEGPCERCHNGNHPCEYRPVDQRSTSYSHAFNYPIQDDPINLYPVDLYPVASAYPASSAPSENQFIPSVPPIAGERPPAGECPPAGNRSLPYKHSGQKVCWTSYCRALKFELIHSGSKEQLVKPAGPSKGKSLKVCTSRKKFLLSLQNIVLS